MYGTGDVRFEEREDPKIIKPDGGHPHSDGVHCHSGAAQQHYR